MEVGLSRESSAGVLPIGTTVASALSHDKRPLGTRFVMLYRKVFSRIIFTSQELQSFVLHPG